MSTEKPKPTTGSQTKDNVRAATAADKPKADPNILYRKKVALLQRTVKDVCGRIHDHPGRSLTVRIRRTAHLSIEAKKAIVDRLKKSVQAFETAVLSAPGSIADDFNLEAIAPNIVLPTAAPAEPKPEPAKK